MNQNINRILGGNNVSVLVGDVDEGGGGAVVQYV